jgi:hypothetical protein
MKRTLICAVALGVLTAPCAAQADYDRKLEKAVMGIVAKKMGELRGGLSYDAGPAQLVVPDQDQTGSIVTFGTPAPPTADGMAPSIERRMPRIIAY